MVETLPNPSKSPTAPHCSAGPLNPPAPKPTGIASASVLNPPWILSPRLPKAARPPGIAATPPTNPPTSSAPCAIVKPAVVGPSPNRFSLAVLSSPRAFVRLRALATTHQELAARLGELEEKTEALAMHHDTFSRNTRAQLRRVFDDLRDLMTPPEPVKRPIGFVHPQEAPGKSDAKAAAVQVVKAAKAAKGRKA